MVKTRSILENAKTQTLEKAVESVGNILTNSSDKRLMQMAWLFERIARGDVAKREARHFRWLIETGHPFKEWIRRIAQTTTKEARRSFIRSVFVDGILLKEPHKRLFNKEHGFRPPNLIVISSTQRCNLRCVGCWAGEYTRESDMPIETVRKIVKEGHDEMHMRLFVMTGGEPFVRDDLMDIYEEFNDCCFIIYTNGTLITQEIAKRMGELGNCIPCVSLEGDKAFTDARRGKGVYRKVMKAFEYLRGNGVLFGFSAMASRENIEYLGSDEWIESVIDAGCHIGWYFQYIPIGSNPDPDLQPTPEQRNVFRKAVYRQRNKYPIFCVDFWNDGPVSSGCLAGGKVYLHINTNGDIEPCVFAHFAVDNIHETTVVEALQSDFFKAIRGGIPYDGNLLRACMIIDRPEKLRGYCEQYGAHPTHPGGESLLTTLAGDIDRYAEGVKELYDPAWGKGDYIRHFPDPPDDYK